MIAQIIERYVTEHPRAADTAKGICEWWVAPLGPDASMTDVQLALDYLAERNRLSRIVLADGTIIFSRAASRSEDDEDEKG